MGRVGRLLLEGDMKYIDLIAYPLMIAAVYVLVGLVQWDKDPANWTRDTRFLWVLWGLVWGFALRLRILKELGKPTWTL